MHYKVKVRVEKVKYTTFNPNLLLQDETTVKNV